MSVVIDIDHESNNIATEYTANVNDGGDLAITAAAALVGSYGLSVTCDDGNAIYAYRQITANTSGVVRARIYFDPNTCTMSPLASTTLVYLTQNNMTTTIGSFQLVKSSGGTFYQVRVVAIDDTTFAWHTVTVNITDAPHYIEMMITRASTNTAADGVLSWWVDGVEQTAITGIDNYDRFPHFGGVIVGYPLGGTSVSGTYYLDDVKANDDGSEIGAAGSGVSIALDLAVITAAGPALDVAPGPVAISLDAAALTLAGPVLTITLGGAPLSVALAVASLIASAPALTVAPGPVALALALAELLSSAPALDVAPGPVSVSLSAAELLSSGPALDVAPGPVSISLSAAELLSSGPALDVTPGAVSISMSVANIAAAGLTIIVSSGTTPPVTILLSAAALTASAPALTIAPGPVSVMLALAEILGAAPTISVSAIGGIFINLRSAAIVAASPALSVAPGPVSISLDAAAIAVAALAIAAGNITVGTVGLTVREREQMLSVFLRALTLTVREK